MIPRYLRFQHIDCIKRVLRYSLIAQAFGFSRGYLYKLWGKFREEGTVALIDKRWGTA